MGLTKQMFPVRCGQGWHDVDVNVDYSAVTEVDGELVSSEQIDRMSHRYRWAGDYAMGMDVLEIACGSGQGIGYVSSQSKTFVAGDVTPALVLRAQQYCGEKATVTEMDALDLPFESEALDVVILFEAIYYLSNAELFIDECVRVLRPGGKVLIASTNKDLYDFNPSPHSTKYFGVVEMADLLSKKGFRTNFFGYMDFSEVEQWQRILRPVKNLAVRLNLIPRSMKGKEVLKRLVFGKLHPMPAQVPTKEFVYEVPEPITSIEPNTRHKVLYCEATLLPR